MRNMLLTILVAWLSVLLPVKAWASAEEDSSVQQYQNKMTLADMGYVKGIVFRGGQKDAGVMFSLPIDQLVNHCLLYTSPSPRD